MPPRASALCATGYGPCAGLTFDDVTCADLASEDAHCGACDNACDAVSTTGCTTGECTCECAGLTFDDATCADPSSEVSRCGSCDNACGYHVRGWCVPVHSWQWLRCGRGRVPSVCAAGGLVAALRSLQSGLCELPPGGWSVHRFRPACMGAWRQRVWRVACSATVSGGDLCGEEEAISVDCGQVMAGDLEGGRFRALT
jgi:hypothetical protein